MGRKTFRADTRGPDSEDMQDIRFYLQRDPTIGITELQTAFAVARGPDVPEIWQLFAAAKPVVLSMAQELRGSVTSSTCQ